MYTWFTGEGRRSGKSKTLAGAKAKAEALTSPTAYARSSGVTKDGTTRGAWYFYPKTNKWTYNAVIGKHGPR